MSSPPTRDELELMADLAKRRIKLPGQPLRINNRLFDKNFQMDGFTLENTIFENCDFEGSIMTRGTLQQVKFNNCLFVANTFNKGVWNDVAFTGCASRGPIKMGAPDGKNLSFDDCEFAGATPEEMGFGGRAEQYGSIGGTDGPVAYRKCQFTRMFINGGATLNLKDCQLNDVIIDAQDHAALALDHIKGKGFADFGTQSGKFSTVSVKNTDMDGVLIFDKASMTSAIMEDVKANIDLTRVHARSVTLKRITFVTGPKPEAHFEYGLHTTSAKIDALTLEDCTFEGALPTLYLAGKKNRQQAPAKPAGGERPLNLYSTAIGNLTVRNTPVIKGQLMHMELGTFTVENTRVSDTDLSNSAIGKYVLNNVTLSGKVEYANTTIVQKLTDRVTDTSTGTPPVIGKADGR